jgi:adenylosuccinate lyase
MEARESGRHMKEVLMLRPEVAEFISAEEIEGVMDPVGYIGTAVEQVEAVVERLRGKKH